MRKVNAVTTVVLASLAAAAWALCFYNAWVNWSIPPAYMVLATTLTACACIGWILLSVSERRGDDETRCRKCRYILRGLSALRCPECGEPI